MQQELSQPAFLPGRVPSSDTLLLASAQDFQLVIILRPNRNEVEFIFAMSEPWQQL